MKNPEIIGTKITLLTVWKHHLDLEISASIEGQVLSRTLNKHSQARSQFADN